MILLSYRRHLLFKAVHKGDQLGVDLLLASGILVLTTLCVQLLLQFLFLYIILLRIIGTEMNLLIADQVIHRVQAAVLLLVDILLHIDGFIACVIQLSQEIEKLTAHSSLRILLLVHLFEV